MTDQLSFEIDELSLITDARQRARWAAGAFLASYSSKRTREGYAADMRTFFAFLDQFAPDLDPIHEVRRAHVDTYARWLEDQGRAPATVARRLAVVTQWYRYLVADEILVRNPAEFVKRPKVPRESNRDWMRRQELQLVLDLAKADGGYPYALLQLLASNGLRVGEACAADVEDLGVSEEHRTLRILGKGNKPDLVPLPPVTARAIDNALDGRERGPLFLTRYGTRMNREAAGRICRKYATKAGIPKNITPHSFRHSSITTVVRASNGNVELARQFARHSDVTTTMRYVRSMQKLDGHAAYLVTHDLAGGD